MIWRKETIKLKELKPCKDVNWSPEQLKMIVDIENNYNDKISKLWISNTNQIIDGSHRYTILLNKYGGEHKLNVIRFNMSMKMYNALILTFFPITLGILLPIYMLTQSYKKNKWLNK